MIPDAIAAEYEAALLAHVALRWAALLRALPVELRDAEAPDDAAGEAGRADAAPSALSLVGVLGALRRLTGRWAVQKADPDQLAQVSRVVETVVGASLQGAMERAGVEPPAGRLAEGAQASRVLGWAEENVKLIRSLDERMVGDVIRLVARAAEDGTQTRTLARQIAERAQVSQARARVIARDQVGKLASLSARERSKAAGAQTYRWSASGDERVRPEHQARNGKTFRFDDPPPGGHPGEAVLCRCVAVPIFDL